MRHSGPSVSRKWCGCIAWVVFCLKLSINQPTIFWSVCSKKLSRADPVRLTGRKIQLLTNCSRRHLVHTVHVKHFIWRIQHAFVGSSVLCFSSGEANVHRVEKYSCQIQAMVSKWRAQFHIQSLQQTSSHFPFGYVQVGEL